MADDPRQLVHLRYYGPNGGTGPLCGGSHTAASTTWGRDVTCEACQTMAGPLLARITSMTAP